jgi:hypothetical protein
VDRPSGEGSVTSPGSGGGQRRGERCYAELGVRGGGHRDAETVIAGDQRRLMEGGGGGTTLDKRQAGPEEDEETAGEDDVYPNQDQRK